MLLRISKISSVAQICGRLLRIAGCTRVHNFPQIASYCILKNRKHFESADLYKQTPILNHSIVLKCAYSSEESEKVLDRLTFENVCSETLDSLSEYFEEIVESVPTFKNADVMYSDGVLTVNLGANGTYVINRQTPNLQIWLSSPTSGPKRYDYIDGTWVYKHDKTTLHSLLDKEIKDIANEEFQFVEKCLHAKASI